MRRETTVCLRCHQKCVLTAEIDNGRIVRIHDAPCIKGTTIPDVMYHPDRLEYPLKRVGERGEGKWERISWDEALDSIGSKLKEIREKYGPEAITWQGGSGQKQLADQAEVICRKIWSLPNTHYGRYTCVLPDNIANRITWGEPQLTYETGQDYERSKCIMYWGANPDATTPAQTLDARKALRQGARLIVVDPRPIPMARKADVWLKIRPGTDMALALAMINVVINEGIYDKWWVENYCEGFDRLKEHVQEYTADWAAEVCWLSSEDIVRAARMFATTKPACVYVRCGAGGQKIDSFQTSRAIDILISLCGNIDVPGGNLMYFKTFSGHKFGHMYLQRLKCSPRDEVKRFGMDKYTMMQRTLPQVCYIPDTVDAMEDGRIKALWCCGDNLIVAELDMRRLWKILRGKLELVFVSEFFMTPTAELADFVLPAAFYQEVDNIVDAFTYPYNYATACKRLVEPLGECRDDRWVAIELAKRMGLDVDPWGSVEEYLNYKLKYMGLTFEDVWKMPDHRITFPREFKRWEGVERPFGSISGKCELYSKELEMWGYEPLPIYREPPESPISTPQLFEEFPFIYTHYRSAAWEHSEGRQIERQRRLDPEPCLELHPDAAAKHGIRDGDWVYLETPLSAEKGWRVTFKAKLVPDIFPCLAAGPHAWWFPEKPGPEHGCFDSNINALLTLGPPYDPVTGLPQLRAFLCRVGKLET